MGAYTLTEPLCELPRVPTPEMAPMLDAMVIDVPSEEEGDMLSLGDEDDTPFPQGLKLNLDNDTSDYGEDPETLCGPIIEPELVPAPLAGPVRILRHAWEKKGPQPYQH